MTNSFKAFMSELIDYAGLFPPARLPLRLAVEEYLRHRQEPEAWILNRFICPVQKLHELIPYKEKFQAKLVIVPLTVLFNNAENQIDYLSQLENDLNLLQEFQDEMHLTAAAEVFELRISMTLFDNFNENKIHRFLTKISDLMKTHGYEKIMLFLELQRAGVNKKDLSRFFQAVSQLRASVKPNTGVKVRCGGEDAGAFPEPEELAGYLNFSVTMKVPFKATAGLHHPVRHFNSSVKTKMHGFLNVFGAALLAFRHYLNSATILEILEDEEATHFSFTPEAFIWKNLEITAIDIRNLRNSRVFGFGSCSFDEPRDDLKNLGLL
jgi:hypothetical protein